MPLSQILGYRSDAPNRGCQVVLRQTDQSSKQARPSSKHEFTILVDAIVGVEEVVVRSLPPLLQRNELFAGVTLSGRAEIVLLLDVNTVIDLHSQRNNWASMQVEKQGQHNVPSAGIEGHARILVVDDSVVIRRSLARKLKSIGYDVAEACNGHDALTLLRVGGIDAVVTDIDMPGMNGLDLLQEMKRQEQLKKIPVTVLTSRDEDQTVKAIRNLKPVALLSKPVTDAIVSAIVGSLGCTQFFRQVNVPC